MNPTDAMVFPQEVEDLRKRLDQIANLGSDRTAVVVLTWNSRDFIESCLDSIESSIDPLAVLVVDNGSHDGTQETVAGRHGTSILETHQNLGYAGGNNLGIKTAIAAGADYVILVNPDATVASDCIKTLVDVLTSDQGIGLASPVICYDSTSRIWYGGSDVDLTTGTTYHLNEGVDVDTLPDDPFETGRASGCVLAFRADVLSSVGLLDEHYFLYYEESEWSLRMRERGLSIEVVPRAKAWHAVGHGKGSANKIYQYYVTRNRLLLIRQHGDSGLMAAIPKSLKDSLLTLWRITRSQPSQAAPCLLAIMRGYVDFLRGEFGEQSRRSAG